MEKMVDTLDWTLLDNRQCRSAIEILLKKVDHARCHFITPDSRKNCLKPRVSEQNSQYRYNNFN